MSVADDPATPKNPWLDQPITSLLRVNWETILFALLLILAVVSRFYDLEARVMSHDENSHVYFSWLFEQGSGYSHDPVTHGPFQFHIVALSYFLFGDNDFTARIPAALFSIATIAFMWAYRRLIGRIGALLAAFLLLISPFLLYYGRYVRNEAFVAFYGVITIWAIIRYLESGANRYLIWFTVATALHFATKETSYIYAAQALLFLACYLIYSLSRKSWGNPAYRNRFFIFLILALAMFATAGGLLILSRGASNVSGAATISPAIPGQQPLPTATAAVAPVTLTFALGGIACLAVAVFFVLRGYTWNLLKQERSFSLLILLGTLVLPLLAAFPVKLLGISPIDYQSSRTIFANAAFVILFAVCGSALVS